MAVIATLGGSGYESTGYLQVGEHRYRSIWLMPDLVVIDRRMMRGTERRAVVSAALVALTQAVEAAMAGNNRFTATYAEAAIRFIAEGLPRWLADESDGDSALALANGCHCAGCAFANVSPGPVHTLGRQMAPAVALEAGVVMSYLLIPYLRRLSDEDPVRVASLLPFMAEPEEYAASPLPEVAMIAVRKVSAFLDHARGKLGVAMRALPALEEGQRAEVVAAALEEGKGAWDRETCFRIIDAAMSEE
ncbi:MAG: iron-containing alcohol dehydrogenase [Syntrophales bacterium]|nr:iron-containing alcohol dehydrogenase [Syntrophales bacterium]